MNFGALFKALDTVLVLGDTARRIIAGQPTRPEEQEDAGQAGKPAGDRRWDDPGGVLTTAPGLTGFIESRLTNVMVAALKEAFDRDHARLELERTHLEAERRRAEEALRLEVRRQAADRELNRLRLLAGVALVGWIAAVLLLVTRLDDASLAARAVAAGGWALLLAALGAAFSAQGRVVAAASQTTGDAPVDGGRAGAASMWLLVAGLGVSAVSLLV